MAEKEYDVPEELVEIIKDSMAAADVRDSAAKGFFKWQVRNAIYAAKMSAQYRIEFWEKICEIYPELSNKKASYNPKSKKVTLEE